MASTPTVLSTGQARTAALTNVRQGSPTRTAPVAQKLATGTDFAYSGITAGEAVQGNAQWLALDGNRFIWSGACTLLGTIQTPAPSEQTFPGFGLAPEFASKLGQLFAQCRAQGLEFRISQGLRTPQLQARYYCISKGRTEQQIQAKVQQLKNNGAPWLAGVLEECSTLPRGDRWLTNALPGAGWHQWGEAADCYCYRDGIMVGNGSDPCYKRYADLARSLGLTAGYYFSDPDAGHVQFRSAGGATALYTWSEIDHAMQLRFGDKPGLD